MEAELKKAAEDPCITKSTPVLEKPKNNVGWSEFKPICDLDIAKIILIIKPNNHYNDPLPAKCWSSIN